MYFVMLMLRFVLGTGGGTWGPLELAPVRTGIPSWIHPVSSVPDDWSAESGHLRIRSPIRSPHRYRRFVNRPPTGLASRVGPRNHPPTR